MRRITAIEHLTLDGVMQAPGRPDEDERGGFAHGGWAPVALRLVDSVTTTTGVLIATYEPDSA